MNVANPPEPGCAERAAVYSINLADALYPPLLRGIHDPPDTLYLRGDPQLLCRPQLAIVGARRASAVAQRIAESLAAAAVGAGLQVCSGMALGIDGAAHRGALSAGGTSIAVMGTGIDSIYPSAHRDLAEEIVDSGCLVTELPVGAGPRRQHFPKRNRIISGMSLGVLVVEAALPSGSLITARTALEQGREVFALPWSIAHQGGAGCLRLLRDGAHMVLTIDDVLDQLSTLYDRQLDLLAESDGEQAAKESDLLRLLGCEEVGLDELLLRSGLPAAELLSELSALELSGDLVRGPAGGYLRA